MPGRHLVFSCLLITALPAVAEMYTWTDAQGTTHFSDRAPAVEGAAKVTLGKASVLPMSDNILQSEKVETIRRQVEQSLERDIPRPPSRQRSDSPASGKACEKLENRLAKIQQRLRTGYSNDRGNSLRRQRRTLSQRHSRECVLG